MFTKKTEKLEQQECDLEAQVRELSQELKSKYFKEKAKKLKDPDDYAMYNYLFIGGFHHLYLGNYKTFIIELSLLLIALVLFGCGYPLGLLLIIAISIYEIPQLFMSQFIVRNKNLEISKKILIEVNDNSK